MCRLSLIHVTRLQMLSTGLKTPETPGGSRPNAFIRGNVVEVGNVDLLDGRLPRVLVQNPGDKPGEWRTEAVVASAAARGDAKA